MMVRGQHSAVAPAAAPAEDVVLRTSDRLSIAATYTPGRSDRSPGVLLLHGVGASRVSTAANADWLASLGYATLAIDFRGHGQSDIAPRTFGISEALDARAAFDWLKHRQQGAPVAVIGMSLGGAASLIGDEGPLPADALILQAVYPDIRHAIRNRIASRLPLPLAYLLEPLLSFQSLPRFGVWPSRLSPIAALSRYRGPVLIVGGEMDRSTPPAETRALFAAVTGPREIWMTPVGDHAAMGEPPDPGYRIHLKAFLERSLAGLAR